jgi:hypothetical protein
MSQAGYTPIQLYFSTTAAAVPVNTNLANGELAINITDEKLYFKNAAGVVKLLASNATSAPVLSFSAGTTGFTPSTATSGAITLAGTLATTNGGTGLTAFTANQVFYASSTSAIAQSANMTFNGTTLTVNDLTDSSLTAGRVTYAGTSGNLVDSANLTYSGTVLGVASGIFKANGAPSLVAATAGEAILAPEGTLGALVYGRGTTYDVTLGQRSTGVALGVLAGTSNLYAPGSVGIATTTPTSLLSVGTLGASSNPAIQIGSATNSSGSLYFGDGVGANTYRGFVEYGHVSDAMLFGTAGVEQMRITSTGAVGIGTNSPTFKFHVYSTFAVTSRFQSTASVSVIDFADSTSTNPPYLGSIGDVLYFGTSSSNRFQIGAAGQLGIGGANYGTSGQVLTSGGSAAAPTWANAGKVLQVVQGTSGAQATTTSGNWDSTGLTASITPTSSSSKILVLVSGGMEGGAGGSGDQSIGFKVYRGASSIEASTKGKVIYALPNIYVPINFIALDSPATTSSTAYTLYFKRISGDTTASFCRDSLETANIVLMEIAA